MSGIEIGTEIRIDEEEMESLSPVARIARLYQGAIGFVDEARGAPDESQRRYWIGRALSIVDALQSHLDLEAGGEIAGNLSDLYDFARGRLQAAVGDEFDRSAAEAVGVLELLGSGWEELAQQSSTAAA